MKNEQENTTDTGPFPVSSFAISPPRSTHTWAVNCPRPPKYGLLLLVTVGLFSLSGASCPRGFTLYPSQAGPRVLPASPGLEQVLQAVNRNNSQIQQFSSSSATLSTPGYPSLRANIAYQRPRLFRLRGETGITGTEVDLGSNDELFWFWIKRNEPPAVYFCRHEQFPTCRARQMIPIDPSWLVEALGTSEIDPALPHQGPYPAKGNRLQIRTIRETADGPTTKITVIDANTAWVMEQHIYDAQGRLRASSVAEGYRRDPYSGLFVPTAIRVDCPPAQFSMRLDLGNAQVNRLQATPEMWSMPNYPGTPLVDLCDPSLQFGSPAGQPRAATRLQSYGPRWR